MLDNLADDAFDASGDLKPEHHATKLGKEFLAAAPGFDFGPAADQAPLKVHLRLAAATEGEHNNGKDSQKRFFLIYDAEPVKMEIGRGRALELVIQFEYRADAEKPGRPTPGSRKACPIAHLARHQIGDIGDLVQLLHLGHAVVADQHQALGEGTCAVKAGRLVHMVLPRRSNEELEHCPLLSWQGFSGSGRHGFQG